MPYGSLYLIFPKTYSVQSCRRKRAVIHHNNVLYIQQNYKAGESLDIRSVNIFIGIESREEPRDQK